MYPGMTTCPPNENEEFWHVLYRLHNAECPIPRPVGAHWLGDAEKLGVGTFWIAFPQRSKRGTVKEAHQQHLENLRLAEFILAEGDTGNHDTYLENMRTTHGL